MGMFLGVAQGSAQEPKLIHLAYIPKNPKDAKRAAAGAGGQGHHLRLGRPVAQAGRRHDRHEDGHGGLGGGAGRHAGHRRSCSRPSPCTPSSARARTCPRAPRTGRATSSPRAWARRWRSPTRTPRAAWCWATSSPGPCEHKPAAIDRPGHAHRRVHHRPGQLHRRRVRRRRRRGGGRAEGGARPRARSSGACPSPSCRRTRCARRWPT